MVAGCTEQPQPADSAADAEPRTGVAAMTMTVRSSAFENGRRIPKKYTGDGGDLSPPLSWDGVPDGTKELVLIVDDPGDTSHALMCS